MLFTFCLIFNADKYIGTSSVKCGFTGKTGRSIGCQVTILRRMPAFQKPKQMIYNLTAKELEVLQRLVESDSYKLIAHHCQISISTVQTHIMHIYEKLHVNSKGEAINKVLRDKIVNFSR